MMEFICYELISDRVYGDTSDLKVLIAKRQGEKSIQGDESTRSSIKQRL